MIYIHAQIHRSLLLVILLPAGHFDDLQSHNVIERCGFIAITVVQLAASFVIYLALHHEAQFRSSGMHCAVYVYVYTVKIYNVSNWLGKYGGISPPLCPLRWATVKLNLLCMHVH